MLFNYTDHDILNEAYFGKHNNLKKCENLLDEIIIDLKNAHKKGFDTKNMERYYDINTDIRIREIEHLIAETFNIKRFELTFYIDYMAYNAFTIPTVIPILNKDKNSKYGLNSSNYKLNCHIDSMMLILGSFTGGEVLAIILHEIGHNFDTSIFFILSKLSLDVKQILVNMIDMLPPVGQFYGKIFSLMDKFTTMVYSDFPILKQIMIIYNNIVYSIYKTTSIKSLFIVLSNPIIYLNALDPSNIFGYGNEKFADSFATAHGYGKELISGLDKLSDASGLYINKAVNTTGLVAIPYDITNIMTRIAKAPLDPHPQTPIRIRSIINKLKRDLNDPNLNPKLKKELIEQIKDIEKFIDEDYTNINNDENKKRIIKILYTKLLMSCPIDIREIGQIINPREL